jgi:hypothetical protein
MTRYRLTIITLVSLPLLPLDVFWTRILPPAFFSTFAFLALSLAIMGLGLGALALRLFPSFRRDAALGVFLSLTGLAAIAGPPLVFELGIDFQLMFSSRIMVGKVALMIVLLASAFFFGGVAVGWLSRRNSSDMPRLYAADLAGAGLGVFAAIWAMNQFGTPAAAFLSVLPVFLAALIASPWWLKLFPVALIAVLAVLVPRAPGLLELERRERAVVIYKHWDAMAKVKAYAYGGGVWRGLEIDNVANTPVIPFDGDWEHWYENPANSEWDINSGYLIDQFDDCTFLSLGVGGGADVLQALDQEAMEVHAVGVNGHINRMLTEGDPSGYILMDSTVVDSTGAIVTMAEFSGHIYNEPRVTVVTVDARTYGKRHKNKFDVFYSLSSNTWAALGSGAFALTENCLFTVEAFKDYWNALTDGGYLSMEHQVYMPRLVTQVKIALEELGVENPFDHFAVYNLPRMRRNLLLLSKRPLTDDFPYRAFGELTPEYQQHMYPLYPAPDSVKSNLVNQIVLNGWEAMADSAAINLSPCTDDRPFVAQMRLWKNVDHIEGGQVSRYAEFQGFPMSKLMRPARGGRVVSGGIRPDAAARELEITGRDGSRNGANRSVADVAERSQPAPLLFGQRRLVHAFLRPDARLEKILQPRGQAASGFRIVVHQIDRLGGVRFEVVQLVVAVGRRDVLERPVVESRADAVETVTPHRVEQVLCARIVDLGDDLVVAGNVGK